MSQETFRKQDTRPVIRQKTLWEYSDPTDISSQPYRISSNSYDLSGKELELIEYLEDGQISTRCVLEYDTYGNLIKKVIYEAGQKRVRQYSYSYRFDDQGRVVQMVEQEKGALLPEVHFYAYDDYGNCQERVRKGDETIYTKEYNSARQLINYYSSGTRTLYQHEYDEKRNIIRSKESRPKKPDRYISYQNKYDRAGNLVCVKTGGRMRWYKYNKWGDVVEERWDDENGKPEKILKYTYEYFADG